MRMMAICSSCLKVDDCIIGILTEEFREGMEKAFKVDSIVRIQCNNLITEEGGMKLGKLMEALAELEEEHGADIEVFSMKDGIRGPLESADIDEITPGKKIVVIN